MIGTLVFQFDGFQETREALVRVSDKYSRNMKRNSPTANHIREIRKAIFV
jgi:hypothetical protein